MSEFRWRRDTDDSDSRFQRRAGDAVGGRNYLVVHVHGWSRRRLLHVVLQLGRHPHLHRRFSRQSLLRPLAARR